MNEPENKIPEYNNITIKNINSETAAGTNDFSPDEWKKNVKDKINAYIDNISNDKLPDILNKKQAQNNTPDLFSFFSELAALKQEIKLKNRIEQKNNKKQAETLESLNKDFSELKAKWNFNTEASGQLQNKADEKINKLLLEIIALREALLLSLPEVNTKKYKINKDDKKKSFKIPDSLRKKYKKKKRVIKDFRNILSQKLKQGKKQKKILKELIADINTMHSNQEILLVKIDDLLKRYNVEFKVHTGDIFDASYMKVIEVKKNKKKTDSGIVTKVFSRAYLRNNTLIQAAEVRVRK